MTVPAVSAAAASAAAVRVVVLIAGAALLAGVAEAGEVGRFRPATPDYVVLKVPASASNDAIAVFEQRHARELQNEAIASQLAELYLARARTDREPRYFARAEALLKPWASRDDASASTLRVQADILQNRHDFPSAMKLLDRAITLAPRDAGARLMRASVKMVGGHAAEARADCSAVFASGESATGTICLAQVLAATGGLARADALLKTLLSASGARAEALAPSVRAWALWLLADFADRAGDPRAAEVHLRAALEADPQNEGIRSALSDLLLKGGAYRGALALVDLPAPSIGLLARRARAQQLLHDPEALEETRSQIDELVQLASRRGDPPHLREEALVALDIDHDPARALELAKANFDTQRETIDIRLLIRAAQACEDNAALRDVAQWIRQTGYEDHQLRGATLPATIANARGVSAAAPETRARVVTRSATVSRAAAASATATATPPSAAAAATAATAPRAAATPAPTPSPRAAT
jgi:tetratricopeptide (TPR) repeat protein